ncbi:M13 family metallopeptidase [Xylocopilactobacillus apicola]|uniref:Endopeptidase n=1 Tax=Xylocopilactobacillus apicola TaxID=2932184 RepID=A0AAU9DS37_9LACO|nr:M13 family metallopeptidase [Xylocopilactobacillus apicola]BDR58028.1 endopeptidase [Xylocopilactobacillus apicola]
MKQIPRIQDDLYGAINGKWQQVTEIKPDRNTAGASTDLEIEIEQHLIADLKETLPKVGDQPTDNFSKAAKLFDKARDFKRRNAEGIKPVLARLSRVLAIKNLSEFNEQLPKLMLEGYAIPLEIGVMPDLSDATRHQVIAMSPGIILPDVTTYDDPEQSRPLLAVYQKMITELVALTPLSAKQQEQFVKDTLAFDRLIVPFHLSNEEMAEVKNLDHPMPASELVNKVAEINLQSVFEQVFPIEPTMVNVFDLKFFDHFAEVFNEETFTLWQHWAYVNELCAHAGSLSQEIREIGAQYSMAISGQQELSPAERHAYYVANSIFDEPIGIYYGKKYFGPDAKADVTQMVQNLIQVYVQQIERNSWLSDSTKKMAIKKLSTMEIKMGYPDRALPLYDQFQIKSDLSLSETLDECGIQSIKYSLDRLDQPVDRSEWGMSGQVVNAQYDDSLNDITFPAAILQPPYYSVDASLSANLGGAGATIGHEISHAFDNNGALFDELGNKKDWWQPADYENFEKYTQAMVEQFDGIPYAGGKINGKLVVSENIADNAGINAALQVLHASDNPDFAEFFKNYAMSWRTKIRPELAQMLLSVDVHAPAELRTNVPVPNFPEWYEAFDVKPTDRLYRKPEDRLIIW